MSVNAGQLSGIGLLRKMIGWEWGRLFLTLFIIIVVHVGKTHVEKEEIDLNSFEKLLQEIGVRYSDGVCAQNERQQFFGPPKAKNCWRSFVENTDWFFKL